MKKKRFKEEQIIKALKRHEAGEHALEGIYTEKLGVHQQLSTAGSESLVAWSQRGQRLLELRKMRTMDQANGG